MTAEEVVNEGCSIPIEGEDITPKKDGGVFKGKYCSAMSRIDSMKGGVTDWMHVRDNISLC